MKFRALASCTAVMLFIGIAGATTLPSSDTHDANEMVRIADAIRFPPDGFQVDIHVTNHSPDRNPQEKAYRVLAKGPEKSLVMTVSPQNERGQILLMLGNHLWAYMPNVSQPIRLPLSQRLTGQVANGDLARAQFAQDYSATTLRQEVLDEDETNILELVAHKTATAATYKRILYWLHAIDNRPLKAEFYSASGKLLKTAHFGNYQLIEGKSRPTRLVIMDDYLEGRYSVLTYSNIHARNVPDRFFSKNYLKKLQ